jgi:glycine hydroxymethyltransferase
MHSVAAKAVAFGEAQQPSFTEYSSRVVSNAQALATRLTERGLKLVSGGTDTHLMLLDFSDEQFSGKDAEAALGRAGITTNKNTVPNEKRSPMVTSGVRVGTPAMTTRGANGDDSVVVADWIADVLQSITSEDVAKRVRGEVQEFCAQHPVYGGRV